MSNPTLRALNDSGFPLQVAVHQHIDNTRAQHGWSVRYSEHAWANKPEGRSGFLDLVLHNRHGTTFMAVECKRPRDVEWIFLHSDGKTQTRAHAQGWISHYQSGRMVRFGWSQLALDPTCHEAQFCAIRGQTSNERVTLIEKTAAELVLATESLALEHKDYRRADFEDLKIFFSVIVTTAPLKVAQFDPSAISLKDGTLDSAHFVDVPYVRFRKQLGVHHPQLSPQHHSAGGDMSYLKESTVFVVSAASIADFLSEFEVRNSSLFGG